jgi:hypothetical protein
MQVSRGSLQQLGLLKIRDISVNFLPPFACKVLRAQPYEGDIKRVPPSGCATVAAPYKSIGPNGDLKETPLG